MRWPLTFYRDTLRPGNAGEAWGPVIMIRRGYEQDEGIYQHELLHVGQWAVWGLLSLAVVAVLHQIGRLDLLALAAMPLGFHGLLYTVLPAYKLWAEVQAYRRQARYYPDDRLPLFAGYIANSYGLKVSQDEALRLLRA